MAIKCNDRYPARPIRRTAIWTIGVVLLVVSLAACAKGTPEATPPEEEQATEPPAGVEEEPTVPPEPTAVPTPEYEFMATSALVSSPQDTPEGTFELYLRDAIYQVARTQREKLDMRIRYQDPEILAQDLAGLVVDVTLIEDRSTYYMSRPTIAVYAVDIDILTTYANQETRMQYCDWSVTLEQVGETWYVIGPMELPLFVNCVS